jgi:FMN phosphatase YigB (HAD superfamily)
MRHLSQSSHCPTVLFSQVRAVLLDVDGTLYRQGPVRYRMALALLAFTLRHPVQGLRAIKVLRTFRRLRERLRRERAEGVLCEALQYERPAAVLGVSPESIRKIVADWMVRRPLRHLRACRRQGLAAFLADCRRSGILVGALSDYPPQAKLAALGVRGYFAIELCSTDPEINAFKPSPAGILMACRAWGLRPAEVLSVGDRADVDGEAARAAGTPFVLMGSAGNRSVAVRDFLDLRYLVGLPAEL